MGRRSGVDKVYWLTQRGNDSARALYDRVASDTGFDALRGSTLTPSSQAALEQLLFFARRRASRPAIEACRGDARRMSTIVPIDEGSVITQLSQASASRHVNVVVASSAQQRDAARDRGDEACAEEVLAHATTLPRPMTVGAALLAWRTVCPPMRREEYPCLQGRIRRRRQSTARRQTTPTATAVAALAGRTRDGPRAGDAQGRRRMGRMGRSGRTSSWSPSSSRARTSCRSRSAPRTSSCTTRASRTTRSGRCTTT